MKNFFKSKFGTILVLLATVALAGIAIFTAFRLYKLRQEAVTPNAPTSEPAAATCTQQCPGSDGVLRNCNPPDSDGTSQDSICNSNSSGRTEPCGTNNYCCNGTRWTTDMTKCNEPSATPVACTQLAFTISTSTNPPSSSEPNSCGGSCGSDSNCKSGFTCSAGFCRNSSCTSETDCVCPTATPTGTNNPTNAPTSAPTNTPTGSQPSLPEAGTSLPSILGLGAGGILLLVSLLLAL